jgi:HPt (histidine-containing phosphotransfer) domain-containing protein
MTEYVEKPNYQLTLDNKKIWTFYYENPTIDFESASLLMIEILEKVFNKLTCDNSSSIHAQILSFLSENTRQMNHINETISSLKTDFSNRLIQQFVDSKKEYLDHIQQIVTNDSLSMNDKIHSLMEKNNLYLIDKTSLILNEHVPRQIKDSVKEVYSSFKQDTDAIIKSCNSDKSFQDFLTSFDQRFSTILQSVQQPLFSFFTATEDRILKNIVELRETSHSSTTSQSKMFHELSDFLGKYKNSSHKGKMSEEKLHSVLNELFPSAELIDTSSIKASGDILMHRCDKPSILFENKEYERNVDKEEVSKFIRDIKTHIFRLYVNF